jgi:hypothetical protein
LQLKRGGSKKGNKAYSEGRNEICVGTKYKVVEEAEEIKRLHS